MVKFFDKKTDTDHKSMLQVRPPERVPSGRLKNVEKIGRGVYATVYKVHVDEQVFAYKDLWQTFQYRHESAIAEMAINLSLHHQNVIEASRIVTNGSHDVGFLMDFASQGTLEDYIHSDWSLSWQMQEGFIMNILYGLEYIHLQGVVHRDIKPANIVIDSNHCAKIADFGLAVAVNNVEIDTLNPMIPMVKDGIQKGTPLYMAPEVLCTAYCGSATDMYAFGMLVYSLLTRCEPWPNMKTKQALKEAVLIKQQKPMIDPYFEDKVPKQYIQFYDQLMLPNHTDRPSAKESLNTLFSLSPLPERKPFPIECQKQNTMVTQIVMSYFFPEQQPDPIGSKPTLPHITHSGFSHNDGMGSKRAKNDSGNSSAGAHSTKSRFQQFFSGCCCPDNSDESDIKRLKKG